MSLKRVDYLLTKDEIVNALKGSESFKEDFDKFEITDLNLIHTYIHDNGNLLGIKIVADYKEKVEKDFLETEKNNLKIDIIRVCHKISECINSKYSNERLIRDLVYSLINLIKTEKYINKEYNREFYITVVDWFELLLKSLRCLKSEKINNLDFSCSHALDDFNLLNTTYEHLLIFYTELKDATIIRKSENIF